MFSYSIRKQTKTGTFQDADSIDRKWEDASGYNQQENNHCKKLEKVIKMPGGSEANSPQVELTSSGCDLAMPLSTRTWFTSKSLFAFQGVSVLRQAPCGWSMPADGCLVCVLCYPQHEMWWGHASHSSYEEVIQDLPSTWLKVSGATGLSSMALWL